MIDKKTYELEHALKDAAANHGPDSVEMAECLEKYANFLRENKIRMLDAANMAAKAAVIREKLQRDVIGLQRTSVKQENTKNCPYCAETILAEAVICRFCQRKLSSSPKFDFLAPHLRSRIIPVFATIFSVIVFAACYLAIQKILTPTGSITGGAFLLWDGGDSEILRGQEVVLCKKTLKSIFEDDNQFWAMRDYAIHGYHTLPMSPDLFLKESKALKDLVRNNAIAAVSTDVDGKYHINDIPAGDYCLFSSFSRKRRYDNRRECVIWIIPISTGSGKNQCDLSNLNMTGNFDYYGD